MVTPTMTWLLGYSAIRSPEPQISPETRKPAENRRTTRELSHETPNGAAIFKIIWCNSRKRRASNVDERDWPSPGTWCHRLFRSLGTPTKCGIFKFTCNKPGANIETVHYSRTLRNVNNSTMRNRRTKEARNVKRQTAKPDRKRRVGGHGPRQKSKSTDRRWWWLHLDVDVHLLGEREYGRQCRGGKKKQVCGFGRAPSRPGPPSARPADTFSTSSERLS